ncbi:MAG: 4Fe-4S binding protein [Spirochaetales bacterium]|nr:4Fe-4S binding protein [Spirochaetales bacterium]
MDKILYINVETCMACHSCRLACAVAHSESKNLGEAILEEKKEFPRIILEKIEDVVVPIHCRHCEDAPCITVCPSGAISREDQESPVVLNREKCIGCQACVIVCPFGVIKKGADGKTLIKCDLCIERLGEGREPACAEACPNGTIKYISVKEVNALKHKKRYKVAIKQEMEEA